jgi:hypothetical protein
MAAAANKRRANKWGIGFHFPCRFANSACDDHVPGKTEWGPFRATGACGVAFAVLA